MKLAFFYVIRKEKSKVYDVMIIFEKKNWLLPNNILFNFMAIGMGGREGEKIREQ